MKSAELMQHAKRYSASTVFFCLDCCKGIKKSDLKVHSIKDLRDRLLPFEEHLEKLNSEVVDVTKRKIATENRRDQLIEDNEEYIKLADEYNNKTLS